MEWTAPKFEEIALNCEINSYASAALQSSVETHT
jgi:coenzyme PQQ precursor peptide PqqA